MWDKDFTCEASAGVHRFDTHEAQERNAQCPQCCGMWKSRKIIHNESHITVVSGPIWTNLFVIRNVIFFLKNSFFMAELGLLGISY